MTIEDLRDQGVLLPEEEWGAHRLETTVPEWPLAGAFVVAGASLVVTYLGDGGPLTWAAVVAFLVAIFVVTWLADRAVLRQRRRFRRERREWHGEDGSGDGEGTDDRTRAGDGGEAGDGDQPGHGDEAAGGSAREGG